jgi:hypothetical protein
MRRWIFTIICILCIPGLVFAAGAGWQGTEAKDVKTEIKNFNGNLSSADKTVQQALDTLDDLSTSYVDDTAYSSSWDSFTSIAPSQHAVYNIPKHLKFTIIDPASVYAKDTQVCLWPKTDAAITVTNLEFTCNADPTTEPTGDIKWADTFVGLGNATVINAFDTTAGVTSDSTILSGNVAAGKAIYVSFDATPDTLITQISFDVQYNYD